MQAWTYLIEARNRSIVDERPMSIDKGMGITDFRFADGSAPHVSQDLARKDFGRGSLKVFPMIGGPSLTVDARKMIFICRHTPTVGVASATKIFSALYHECVLSMHKRALYLGRFIRSKAVETTHFPGLLSTNAARTIAPFSWYLQR